MDSFGKGMRKIEGNYNQFGFSLKNTEEKSSLTLQNDKRLVHLNLTTPGMNFGSTSILSKLMNSLQPMNNLFALSLHIKPENEIKACDIISFIANLQHEQAPVSQNGISYLKIYQQNDSLPSKKQLLCNQGLNTDELIYNLDSYSQSKHNSLKALSVYFDSEVTKNDAQSLSDSITNYSQHLESLSLLFSNATQVPIEINTHLLTIVSSLINLRSLTLSFGFLSKSISPEFILSLTNTLSATNQLTEFYFACSNKLRMSSIEIESLHQNLTQMTRLQYLRIRLSCNSAIRLVSQGQHHPSSCQFTLNNFKIKTKFSPSSKFIDSLSIKITDGSIDTAQFATGLKELTELTSLNILIGEEQGFNEDGAVHLASAIQSLRKLTTFSLDIDYYNQIGSKGALALSKAIAQLEQLTSLSLCIDQDQINQEGAIAFAIGFEKLKNLQYLTLSIGNGNRISDAGAEALANSLSNLHSLQRLTFRIGTENDISEKGIQAFGKVLTILKKLEYVSIKIEAGNLIKSAGISSISKFIEQKAKLGAARGGSKIQELELKLNGNQMEFQAYRDLSISVAALQKLQRFTFEFGNGNELNELSGYEICQMLKSIAFNLQFMSLTIYLADSIHFIKNLDSFINLRELHLNFIDAKVVQFNAKQIGKSIEEMNYLQKLVLKFGRENLISNSGAIGIASGISRLSYLEHLHIAIDRSNKVVDFTIVEMAEKIGKVTSLKVFEFIHLNHFAMGAERRRQFESKLQSLHKLQVLHIKQGYSKGEIKSARSLHTLKNLINHKLS